MLKIDKAILNIDELISNNIKAFPSIDRGLLSQNILGHIRNFVEFTAIKVFSNGEDVDPYNYDVICNSLKYVKKNGKFRFLYEFHSLLQKSVSHYTFDKDISERLMLKYYECLLEIKTFLKNSFNLDVLKNISDFPLDTDEQLIEYYTKIAEKIDSSNTTNRDYTHNDRYYVQKIKAFTVKRKIYYEVTFTAATSNTSKYDRVIAFTKHKVIDNYAVKFFIHDDEIHVLNKNMPILIIDDYEVSIRPCEWDNFSKIFGLQNKCNIKSIEYRNLMQFLSDSRMSLTEFVSYEQDFYENVKKNIILEAKTDRIFKLLDQCRDVILNNKAGSNILRYLLYKMNNRVIKQQYCKEQCEKLSNLYLKQGCIPFDNMPYCTSLCQHNPKIYDLFRSISSSEREHELFARYIKNNTEVEGKLFTDRKEIEMFENVDELISKHNSHLYYKHAGRELEKYKDYIYIKGYAQDSADIVKRLLKLSSSGVKQYTASVNSWLSRSSCNIDDEHKIEILGKMFENSCVALIYGSAGTGKSTLINHIASFWGDKEKIFLANTHPAVENMRRKITIDNSEYSTIAKFLSKNNSRTKCDILFIDECSTVSNSDMKCVLEKADFRLLVLVGDVHQIESIYFGNWFSIARKFLPNTSIFELEHPYRTNEEKLLKLWNCVRNTDNSVLELLTKGDYVANLDESIFEHNDDDEIILCLNYDGLYGINNVNRFLQSNNPNKSVTWGINTYKVGDPVLFNESNVFSPLIHNNTKGTIVAIYREEQRIRFDIELDESINEISAEGYNFKLIEESKNGNSIISFYIDKIRSTDEDDDNSNSAIVPFQVAYAVSIHKAQGLEYNSVKIIVTNEAKERITHNIFYTAITRTKNKLKIYWSPEVEKYILDRLKIKNADKDADVLRGLFLSQLSNNEC